jgi:hypothetical protein
VVAAARQGSQPALYALAQRSEGERTTDEWLAMAQGHLRRREVERSLAAYREALDRSPALGSDKTMLAGLRYFAERDKTYEPVLEFAAKHMGERGADLLFHVWASTSRESPHTSLAGKLLQSSDVARHLSEPLRLALELRAAESCEAIRALLPRARSTADERSLIRLKKLATKTGCGESGKEDCYPCLRGDDLLEQTLVQVQMRNAPRFEVPRRWR